MVASGPWTDRVQGTHKLLHKAQNSMLSKIITPSVVSLPDADGHFNPFPAYPFTGSLRPVYPLSPRRAVPDKIKHPDYAHNGIPRSEQVCSFGRFAPGTLLIHLFQLTLRNKIKVLTKEEQAGMRKVCRLAREVLDIAAREVKPGVTTDHIDKVVHEACLARNVSTSARTLNFQI